MPEHVRSLIVLLILSTAVFAIAKRPACDLINCSDFTRRRNLWFALTLTAFLAHNYWLYVFIAGTLLYYSSKRETNKAALFFFVLFAVPVVNAPIPGMGLVNYLFSLSHPRLLALVILLPATVHLLSQRERLPFGRTTPDKLLTGYMFLTAALYLRETTITDTLRQSFYLFTDIFLPYFVISRSLKDLQGFRDTLLSLVIAAMILALVGVFEAYRHWILYNPLIDALGLQGGMLHYLGRAGVLRGISAAGHPIALGYVMAVAIGCYLYLQHSIKNKLIRRFGMALLVAGLIAALSRGPWVGAAVLVVVFVSTGPHALRRLTTLGLAALVSLPLLAALPSGEKVINLIPFIGETEKNNITYRERLISKSLIVIKRHPWFGSINYLETEEMESMRQGQGIIDIVNTYIGVTLERGLVGLALFSGFFLWVAWGIISSLRRIPDKNSDEHLLGRSLLATLIAILLIIFTVSSITIIPIVYWSVAALGVAYTQMINKYGSSRERMGDFRYR
ncbi:MAG: O-antigen ligase family protein [Candidatus Sedimenticola sp. (ex Thyasira tokunagai)]